MNKKRCEVCGSSHTVKNGVRNGVQLYKCRDCGYQFRATIKRRLHNIKREWLQPPLNGDGYVHMDVTYWGRDFGVLLALDNRTGTPLYMGFVKSETVKDYQDAVSSIKERGYCIRGLIIDGKQSLFNTFSEYHIQMCQFHMRQILRRYLILNPKMLVTRDLRDLAGRLNKVKENDFKKDYQEWKEKWKDTINHKSLHKDGKMHYTHRRLRSAMNSLNFYLPYLFTFQREECMGMPNTNNKIEGIFIDLKKNLNNHSGLTMENRKRFISDVSSG